MDRGRSPARLCRPQALHRRRQLADARLDLGQLSPTGKRCGHRFTILAEGDDQLGATGGGSDQRVVAGALAPPTGEQQHRSVHRSHRDRRGGGG